MSNPKNNQTEEQDDEAWDNLLNSEEGIALAEHLAKQAELDLLLGKYTED
jgi:hypothetical protein